MGYGHIIHQECTTNNEPWLELGDQEDVSALAHCFDYLDAITSRVFPVQRTPQGETNCRLTLTANGTDRCDFNAESSRATFVPTTFADEIKPIELETSAMSSSPPWDIRTESFWSTLYSHASTLVPGRADSGDPLSWPFPCMTGDAPPLRHRLVKPLCRIVGFAGYVLKMTMEGTVPKAVFKSGSWSIAKIRLGMKDTTSWANAIGELNEDGTLWSQVDDYCANQSVGPFDVYLPILFCDQTVDMWIAAPGDDSLYEGYPIEPSQGAMASFALNISDMQIVNP